MAQRAQGHMQPILLHLTDMDQNEILLNKIWGLLTGYFFFIETWLFSTKQPSVQIFALLSTIKNRSKNKILLVSLFLCTIIKLGLEFIWLDIFFIKSQCCKSCCRYFGSCQVFWWVFFFSSMGCFCKLGRASTYL